MTPIIPENVMIVTTICGTIISLGLFVLVGYVAYLMVGRKGNNIPSSHNKTTIID